MIFNRDPQSGFTLLEIIIALAILALVFSSLYGAYSGTVEATQEVEYGRDAEQAARLVLMQLTDDLKSLYYKEFKGDPQDSPYRFLGREAEAESGEETILEFASTAYLDFDMTFPNLRINRVSYRLEKQAENETYKKLVRQELPFADLDIQWEATPVELSDRVEELSFAFVNAEGQVVSQWDSNEADTNGSLPRLVIIRLRIAAGKSGGSRLLTTAAALPLWEQTGEGQK